MEKGRPTYPKPEGWEPELTFPKDHRWEGKPRCLAWNRNQGRQCLNMPTKLLGGGHPADPASHARTCRFHGGASLRGLSHPSYDAGQYSRFAPPRLAPIIESFLRADDPLSLLPDIATWEGRIDQLMRSLAEKPDPGDLWLELEDRWRSLWIATSQGRADEIRRQRGELDRIIDQGKEIADTWTAVGKATEQKVKAVRVEEKRQDRLKGYLSVEQATFRFHALGDAVIEGLDILKDQDIDLYWEIRRRIGESFATQVGLISAIGSRALPKASA